MRGSQGRLSGRVTGGISGKRSPSEGLWRIIELFSCSNVVSCSMILDNPYSTAAFASLRYTGLGSAKAGLNHRLAFMILVLIDVAG